MKIGTESGARELLVGMLAPALAGLAVGASMLHPMLAPIQIIAFGGWAFALQGRKGWVGRARPGFWFGASMAALVLGCTGVPAAAALVLFTALSGYWMLLGAGLGWFIGFGGARAWAGATALLTLGEFLQVMLVPMFGTAQRFAGAWVDYDATLPLSRFGGTVAVTAGVAGLAFSWLVVVAVAGRARVGAALSVGAGLVLWMVFAHPAGCPDGVRTVRVAVCGTSGGACDDVDSFCRAYLPLVERASSEGASLVVTPELALFVTAKQRNAVFDRLEAEASRLGVCWVLGYSQYGPKVNATVVLNALGVMRPVYEKTHWVPFLESYDRHGDGQPVIATFKSREAYPVRVGVMICQDDNYEDVAANLAGAGVDIVAVPTLDWRGVASAHLNSARNRPRDFGYIEARAATGGTSAIIDGAGRVLAEYDHLNLGPGYAMARVVLPMTPGSFFAGMGRWLLPAGAGLVLMLTTVLNRRERRRARGRVK